MENTVPFNQEEVKSRLRGYISNNRGLVILVGVGTGAYILGRQAGFKKGYCRGYGQSFKDMVITSNRAK